MSYYVQSIKATKLQVLQILLLELQLHLLSLTSSALIAHINSLDLDTYLYKLQFYEVENLHRRHISLPIVNMTIIIIANLNLSWLSKIKNKNLNLSLNFKAQVLHSYAQKLVRKNVQRQQLTTYFTQNFRY